MRATRFALACSLIALAGAGPAHAGTPGIDLAWGSCDASDATMNQNFGCDTNDRGTPFRLVMTFRNATRIPDFVGVSMVLDFCSGPFTLPNWWMLGTGQCRGGSFVFPGPTTGVGATCANPWTGHVVGGGFTFYPQFGGRWNSARIVMDVSTFDTFPVEAGVRYLAGVATLDQIHTIDDGSGEPVCIGCSTPVCMVLNSVEVFGFSSGEDYLIQQPDTRYYAYWQGGQVGGAGCPFVVATRRSTWGTVKALYR